MQVKTLPPEASASDRVNACRVVAIQALQAACDLARLEASPLIVAVAESSVGIVAIASLSASGMPPAAIATKIDRYGVDEALVLEALANYARIQMLAVARQLTSEGAAHSELLTTLRQL